VVAACRSRSSFRPVDLGVAAAEVGVVVVGEAAVAVVGSADSAAVAGSVAVVAGRAGDENSEP
jgi:hypothetical protein